MISLEGWSSTIELHPQCEQNYNLRCSYAKTNPMNIPLSGNIVGFKEIRIMDAQAGLVVGVLSNQATMITGLNI